MSLHEFAKRINYKVEYKLPIGETVITLNENHALINDIKRGYLAYALNTKDVKDFYKHINNKLIFVGCRKKSSDTFSVSIYERLDKKFVTATTCALSDYEYTIIGEFKRNS